MYIYEIILLGIVETALTIGPLKDTNFVTVYGDIGNDVFFEITEPSELAYTYKIRPAQDFGGSFNESFSVRNAALVVAEPLTACERIKNSGELRGNVALVQRGECSFLFKTLKVEKAGAVAVIVTDYDHNNDNLYLEMVDDNTLREVSIPAGFLLGKNGYFIRTTLKKLNRNFATINIPVNMTSVAINKMNQPPWVSW